MAVSIFTDQTPAVTLAADVTAFALGTRWSASIPGIVTHGRWWFPDTAPDGDVDWVLYSAAGTELARATFTSTSPGWRTVALASPAVYATPGTVMVAAVEAVNRYVSTSGFFEDGPVVSGVLTAPADDNGRVGVGAGYPTGTFASTCYFVDLVFVPTEAAGPRIVTGSTPGRITTSSPMGRLR